MSFRTTITEDFKEALRAHNGGNLAAAEKGYKRVLTRDPRHVYALNNLGAVLSSMGSKKAIEYSLRAAELDPQNVAAWLNLSIISDKFKDKVIDDLATRRAIDLAPDHVEVLVRRANALFFTNRLAEGQRVAERALELDPSNKRVPEILATVLYRQGFLDEALKVCRDAMLSGLQSHDLHSAYLFYLHFSEKPSLKELYEDARQFETLYAAAVAPPQETWPRPKGAPGKRLRVGFVSCDLCSHPVSYFFYPLLFGKTPEHNWDFIGYHSNSIHDEATEQIKSFSSEWRDVAEIDDPGLADLIRRDEIDILIDLNGHTGHHKRLFTFARKPAPIQMTWIGYFDTTGLSTMDYILADPFCIRPEDEAFYVEKVARMPDDFLCYAAPGIAPPVGPLPAKSNGYFTFGSANQITKITPEVLDLWSEVLLSTPGSRLRLKTKALNDAETIARFQSAFVERGIDPSRLDLMGPGRQQEMLAFYGTIDLALDPFPCAGGTTTCEALWMGVPVVSLVGERFCGRHSGSHLSAAGLPEFAVGTKGEYGDLCRSLAADLPRLERLRATLRGQMASSPLMDSNRFAANFAGVLRKIWIENLPEA